MSHHQSAVCISAYIRCSGRIHDIAHRSSHPDRIAGEEDIPRSLGRSDRRMVMFSQRPQHVLQTIAHMGYKDLSVREDSPTYA